MVQAYWLIGKRIVEEEQGGKERAKYGKELLKALSKELSAEFGKGFDERELRRIRQFYLTFPIRDTLRPELSWSHYRLLIRVPNEKARQYYLNKAADQHWSYRTLDTAIWNNNWITNKMLKNAINSTYMIDRERIKTLEPIIPTDEVELFMSKDQEYY